MCNHSSFVSTGLGIARISPSGSLVSGLPQRSKVVASPSPSAVRGVSAANLSGSGLLVQRLGRGLGSSLRLSHRFRPLESGAKHSLDQRQRASSRPRGSPPLPVFSGREECVSVLRQQHGSVLPPQGRRNEVTLPQLSDSGNSPLGRIPLDTLGTPVHPGVSQRAGGLSLSPSPASAYRVVPSSGVFQSYLQHQRITVVHFISLPSGIRWLRARTRSFNVGTVFRPTRFLRGPSLHGFWRSSGRLGTELTLVAPYWPQRPWFPRPSSPVAGPSGFSSSSSRPPTPASVSQPLPGSPQATASCLETLRRFTRAAGFSSSVASQASLSRRPSSRKAYQLKWQVYRLWCHSKGHSVSRPSLSKVAAFFEAP